MGKREASRQHDSHIPKINSEYIFNDDDNFYNQPIIDLNYKQHKLQTPSSNIKSKTKIYAASP